MNRHETAVINFIRGKTTEIFFIAISILAFLLRITFFKNETNDYTQFIKRGCILVK